MEVLNKLVPSKPDLKGMCLDCIFWYQCRKGLVDCNEKNGKNAASA